MLACCRVPVAVPCRPCALAPQPALSDAEQWRGRPGGRDWCTHGFSSRCDGGRVPGGIGARAGRGRPAGRRCGRPCAAAASRPAAIRSSPGWPSTTPVIVVRLPSIVRIARKAKQPPAAASEPVLTPTNPSSPEQGVGVVHGPGDRQGRARRRDDAREHRQAHGPIDDAHLVGGGRHRRVVVAARVGVAGVRHAERPSGGIHPCDEPAERAGVPARQNGGDVVRRRQQQRLQRLPLGQALAGGDRHDRLAPSAPAVRVGDVGVGERDRRAVLAGPKRMVAEHDVGRHHLRDAGDRRRVLVRAGLDLRLACAANAAWPSAGQTVLGSAPATRTRSLRGRWSGDPAARRRREQLIAEGCGDRGDDDEQRRRRGACESGSRRVVARGLVLWSCRHSRQRGVASTYAVFDTPTIRAGS